MDVAQCRIKRFICYVFHFTIYNTKHNSPENYEICLRKLRFFISMGFQNVDENGLHGFGNLVI